MIEPFKTRLLISGAIAIMLVAVSYASYASGSSLLFAQANGVSAFKETPIEALMARESKFDTPRDTPHHSVDQPSKAAKQTTQGKSSQPIPPAGMISPPKQKVNASESAGGKEPGSVSQEKGEAKKPDTTNTSKPAESSKAEGIAGLLTKAGKLAKTAEDEKSLEIYELALKRASAVSDQKLMAAALGGAARMAHQLGRDRKALGYINRAIKINLATKKRSGPKSRLSSCRPNTNGPIRLCPGFEII